MQGVELESNVKLQDHVMVSDSVVIKEGVTIPYGSFCSMLTFDAENKEFVETESENSEMFKKGSIAYIPREIALKESEYLGATSPYNNEESDLDVSDEESDADPLEEFNQELRELFMTCQATQKVSPRPHDEFIKSMVMEIKSLKLTFNVQNEFVTEAIFNSIMKFDFIDKASDFKDLTNEQLAGKVLKTLKAYQNLIKDFISGENEQIVLVEEAEILCAKHEVLVSAFHLIM